MMWWPVWSASSLSTSTRPAVAWLSTERPSGPVQGVVPRTQPLKRARRGKDHLIGQPRPDDLHTDWETVVTASGNADGRFAGPVLQRGAAPADIRVDRDA